MATSCKSSFTYKDKLPTWSVLLHAGPPDVSVPDTVAKVMKYTHLAQPIAQEKVHEATEKNKAVLISTHLERAELINEQLVTCGLCVSLVQD